MESEFGLLTRDEESTGGPIPVLGVLVECNTLIRQITALCAQAERESQISRCLELNPRTKGLEGSLREAIRRMD